MPTSREDENGDVGADEDETRTTREDEDEDDTTRRTDLAGTLVRSLCDALCQGGKVTTIGSYAFYDTELTRASTISPKATPPVNIGKKRSARVFAI